MVWFHLKRWHIRQIDDQDYIFIDAKIANPMDPKKSEKVEFLVDTGATGCAISSELAEKLGWKPAEWLTWGWLTAARNA